MTEKTLNKYKLVIDEWFVNGFNGAKAWRKHYPKTKRADDSFFKIQRITEVQEYIKIKQDSSQKVLKTSHEALLDELVRWAYSDITETLLLTPEQVKELPIEIRRLITKFKTTTKTYTIGESVHTEVAIELHFVSKERAMEMIHKHTGFYEKDNKQKSKETTSVVVEFIDFSEDENKTK